MASRKQTWVSVTRLVQVVWLLLAAKNTQGHVSNDNGINFQHFRGFSNIIEVGCSGYPVVDSSADLFSLVLYRPLDDKVFASVNLKSNECSTSSYFSACAIDSADSHKTRLTTLIVDLEGGQSMVFGCNATSFKTGGRLTTVSWLKTVHQLRMKYRSFQGHPNIVELECSGSVLDSNTDLLSITLYHSETNKVFASMNYAEGKCLTSSSFTLCELDKTASRNARIRTLITDLHYNERRSYSCDITTFKPGERANFVSWSLEVSFASLKSGPFKGHAHIIEVACSGETLDSDSDLLSMVLYAIDNKHVLATVNLKTKECSTSSRFSSCMIDEQHSHHTVLKTLILDWREDEVRSFGCNLTTFKTGDGAYLLSWTTHAQKPKTTTTTTESTTTTTTTTTTPEPPTKAPVASGVKSKFEDFQLPISVIIIGLVLLIFFATLCLILVVMQCKGRRRRRSRAANRESLLSTKNEPMGGGYRNPRNMMVPGQMPPEAVGPNFAMRYQKSIPDTGYVSGSSVYYSEPYGTLDDEMKERLKPNPRLCHIPYDIKGGPLDTQGQEHHSA